VSAVPAGRLRPGDTLTCGLVVAAVADVLPQRLPERYGGGSIRRRLLVLTDSDGAPVARLTVLSVARLETVEPRDF